MTTISAGGFLERVGHHQLLLWLAGGSAVAVMVSNAACQILLGAAILVLLLQRTRWELPRPLQLPLGLFVAATFMSVALSENPIAGLPQIKKLYVFLILPVLFSALRTVWEVRAILLTQTVAASASAGWSVVQFVRKRTLAAATGQDFYSAYVARRVTGFMGHWMTFSAEQMIAGLILGSLLLFGVVHQKRWLWTGALLQIAVGVALGWTRSVWIATAIAACYLIAVRRPLLLIAVPVVFLALWVVSPGPMRERVESIYHPHGQTDSNEHRRVTRVTGIEMIRAHPWFGLGPEMPGRLFDRYVPSYIARPLPEGFYGHLHNVYLQLAAERGLPALAAFLWLVLTALRDLIGGAFRSQGLESAILHGSAAALIGLLLEGFFEHNFGDSEVLTLFFVLLACSYRTLTPRHA